MRWSLTESCLTAPRAALLASAVLAVLTAGCAASGSPDYDSRFGDAAQALRAQQTLDAQAPQRNAGVMPPTDGRSLREVADRHVGTSKEPPPTNIINIGVGAGGNGR